MLAAVVTTPAHIALTQVPCPPVPTGGALVKVTGCGLCGSDLDKLLNRPEAAGQVLGHEVVGVLESLDAQAAARFSHFKPGMRVVIAHHVPCQTCHYCLNNTPSMCRHFKQTNISPGGFAEYIAVTADHLAHTVFSLPESLSDDEASCMEPLACCVRAINRLPNTPNTTALVIGMGFIGLMSAQVMQEKGWQTYGFDLQPERVQLGLSESMIDHGFETPEALLEAIFKATDGRGVDHVMLSVVNPAALELALRAVRDGGNLLLFTSYGPGTPLLDQNALYFREITVYTSYSPGLDDLKSAFEMIASGRVRVSPLISHTMPLCELQAAVDLYKSTQAMKVFITL